MSDKIEQYGLNRRVALLSKTLDKDLFRWPNRHGMQVDKEKTKIKWP